MPDLPPLLRDQRQIDRDNIRLLAIFHFVLAGLSILGLGFLCMHYLVLHTVFSNPDVFKNAQGGPPMPPPAEFFAIFKWFYLVAGVFIVAGGIANLISGLCLVRRKARILSMVIAGFDCMGFPFGTVLGVFTLVVLARESVRELYETETSTTPPPLRPA